MATSRSHLLESQNQGTAGCPADDLTHPAGAVRPSSLPPVVPEVSRPLRVPNKNHRCLLSVEAQLANEHQTSEFAISIYLSINKLQLITAHHIISPMVSRAHHGHITVDRNPWVVAAQLSCS